MPADLGHLCVQLSALIADSSLTALSESSRSACCSVWCGSSPWIRALPVVCAWPLILSLAIGRHGIALSGLGWGGPEQPRLQSFCTPSRLSAIACPAIELAAISRSGLAQWAPIPLKVPLGRDHSWRRQAVVIRERGLGAGELFSAWSATGCLPVGPPLGCGCRACSAGRALQSLKPGVGDLLAVVVGALELEWSG